MYRMTNNRFGFTVAGIAAATMLTLPATAGAGGDATIISGGHEIAVRVDDGEISVIVDGKEIPTDRILTRNGRIVILDEDGNERALFGVLMGDDDQGFNFRFGRHGDFEVPGFEEVMGPRPSVMLGIHMAEPIVCHRGGRNPDRRVPGSRRSTRGRGRCSFDSVGGYLLSAVLSNSPVLTRCLLC